MDIRKNVISKYFSIRLICFDSLHSINNAICTILKWYKDTKIIIKLYEDKFILKYSPSCNVKHYDIDNLDKLNMVDKNFFYLNIFSVLLLISNNESGKFIFKLIDIINNSIFYDFSLISIDDIKEKMKTIMMDIEINFKDILLLVFMLCCTYVNI